jgi:hypothetical protein
MSTSDTIVSAEGQGGVEPSEPMGEEATSYERPDTDENTEDYNDLARSDIE